MISAFKKNRLLIFEYMVWLAIAVCVMTLVGIRIVSDTSNKQILATTRVYNVDVEEYVSLCMFPWFKWTMLLVPIVGIILLFVDKLIIVDKKWLFFSLAISAVMSFWRVIGESYFNARTWNLIRGTKIVAISHFAGYFGLFFLFVKFTFGALTKESYKYVCKPATKKHFFMIWGFLLWAWLPRLIGMYPAYLDTDTFRILSEAYAGIEVTGYVFKNAIMRLVAFVADFIGLEMTLFIYMLFIYLISTLLLSIILSYFKNQRVSLIIWQLVLLYVAYVPRIQEDIFYISKDAQENLFILAMAFCVYLWLMDRQIFSKHNVFYGFIFGLIVLLVFLERKSGGIYVFGILLLSLLTNLPWRENKKKCVRVLAIPIVLLFFYFIICRCLMGIVPTEDKKSTIYKLTIYPVEYYTNRLKFFKYGPIYDRAGVEYYINDAPESFDEEISYLSQMTSYVSTSGGVDSVKQGSIELEEYIVHNNKPMVIEAWLNLLYGYFDIGRQPTTYSPILYYTTVWADYAGPRNQEEILNLEDSYTKNYSNYKALVHQYNVLKNPSITGNIQEEQRTSIVGWINNVGLCMWISIMAIMVIIDRYSFRLLPVLIIDCVCIIGAILSGFAARPRMCAPICLTMLIFILVCAGDKQGAKIERVEG